MSDQFWPTPDSDAMHALARARRNRPGTDGLRWRIGSFATLRAKMLARLPTSRIDDAPAWLAQLNAAVDGRFAYALTDGWALVAEILSFYQDRIAEEGFLQTALLPESLVALAHAVGYRRSPGTSAAVDLVVQVAPTVQQWRLPAGLAIESAPAPGEAAAIFETSEAALMDAAWNAMQVRPGRPEETAPAGLTPVARLGGVAAGTLLHVEPAGGDASAAHVAVVAATHEEGGISTVEWPVDPLHWANIKLPAPAEMPETPGLRVQGLGWFSQQSRIFGFTSPPWADADPKARLAAGSRYLGGLFVADGEGWRPQPLTYDVPIRAIVRGRRHLFLATAGRGILRLTASGRAEPVNTGLDQLDVLCFVRDVAGALYVGTINGGVYRSTDDGENWASINRPAPVVTRRRSTFTTDDGNAPKTAVQALAVRGASRTVQLLVGTARGLFRSVDGGKTWRAIGADLPVAVAAVAISADALWVGTDDGVYRADAAEEPIWLAVGETLPDRDICSLLLVDDVVYVGTRTAGIFRSHDDGATWAAAGGADAILLRLQAGTDDTGDFIAAVRPEMTQISRTGGRTWTPFLLPDGTAPQWLGDRLAFAPQDGFAHQEWPALLPSVALDLEVGGPVPSVDTPIVIEQPALETVIDGEPRPPRAGQVRYLAQVTAVEQIARRDPATQRIRPATRLTLTGTVPFSEIDPRRAQVFFGRREFELRSGDSLLGGRLFMHDDAQPASTQQVLELAARIPALPRGRTLWIVGRRLRAGLLAQGLLAGDAFALRERVTRADGTVVLDDPVKLEVDEVLTIVEVISTGGYVLQRDDGFVGELVVGDARVERIDLRPALDDDPQVTVGVTVTDTMPHRDHCDLRVSVPPEAFAIPFDLSTVTICGNTVHATQGETAEEVIGDGSAAAVFEQFELPDPFVARPPADTPSGSKSALEIHVGEAENYSVWTPTERLVDAGPTDRVFLETVDDTGLSTVTFGDGVHGSRLPTGRDNVIARYRLGIGRAGNVPAGQLNRLAAGSAIIESIHNPVAASGGGEPEGSSVVRGRIPRWVAPAERVLAWRDLADFALTRPGIARAVTHRRQDGSAQLTVSGPDVDIPRLRRALSAAADPLFNVARVHIDLPRVLRFVVDAQLILDTPLHAPVAVVLRAAHALLRTRYAFDARPFDVGISAATVIADLQSVPGVRAVLVRALHVHGNPRQVRSRLELPSERAQPATVLVIDPSPEGLQIEAAQ